MRTVAALRRDRELMPERRRRLHVRDADNPRLPIIQKLLGRGMQCRDIAAALRLDRSRIYQILRAAKARGEAGMNATKEDMAWAIKEAKKIDPNAPRRPLKEFIAELRAKAAAAKDTP